MVNFNIKWSVEIMTEDMLNSVSPWKYKVKCFALWDTVFNTTVLCSVAHAHKDRYSRSSTYSMHSILIEIDFESHFNKLLF